MPSIRLLQESEPNVIQFEIALILALLLILGVALFVRRFRFPYTVTLVIVGLLLAFASNFFPLDIISENDWISSDVILALFVPPLVFEGALHINWRTFRANLAAILLMAVFGVALASIIVGGLVYGSFGFLHGLAARFNLPELFNATQIPFIAAVAFGALISATDPVAVIAFFRSLGVDKRLATLVEGESLLNDGTSIVIFNLALAAGGVSLIEHTPVGATSFSLSGTLWEFTSVSVGGVLVGLVVGYLVALLLKRTDERLVETTLTIPAAFGSYLLAEQLHLSGILAVVAAGMYLGVTLPGYTSPTTKLALYNFWEVLSFIVTSLIFLVIGVAIDIYEFISPENLLLVLAAVLAILAARALVVYGMSALQNHVFPLLYRLRGKPVRLARLPASYQHVMFWGGLRGAISLALALSLPADAFAPQAGLRLRLMTFGVVLFTLLVQGTSIERLIKRLGLAHRSPQQHEKEMAMGRYYAARAAMDELRRLFHSGAISETMWRAIETAQQDELEGREGAVREMLHRHPGTSTELAIQARRLALQAERTAIAEAARHEIVSESIQEEVLEELDAHLAALDEIEQRVGHAPGFEENNQIEAGEDE